MWGSSYGEYLERVVVQHNCCEVPVAVEGRGEWLLPTLSGDRPPLWSAGAGCEWGCNSWASGQQLPALRSPAPRPSRFLCFFLCPSLLSSLSLSISTSLSVSPKHSRSEFHLVPGGSGPCSDGRRRWTTLIHPRWAWRAGITGPCGANELGVCVSEVAPHPGQALFPQIKSEVRLRGLGGCRPLFWGSRERVMGLVRGGQPRRY